MTTLLVTYPGDDATRFDRGYYARVHIPPVLDVWNSQGLRFCSAFFPASQGGSSIATAVCEFRDDTALDAALQSAETSGVVADIARFTDVWPSQRRALPL